MRAPAKRLGGESSLMGSNPIPSADLSETGQALGPWVGFPACNGSDCIVEGWRRACAVTIVGQSDAK